MLRREVREGAGQGDVVRAHTMSSLDYLIDEKGDYRAAALQVRALMFIERFAEDIEAKSEQLGQ